MMSIRYWASNRKTPSGAEHGRMLSAMPFMSSAWAKTLKAVMTEAGPYFSRISRGEVSRHQLGQGFDARLGGLAGDLPGRIDAQHAVAAFS